MLTLKSVFALVIFSLPLTIGCASTESSDANVAADDSNFTADESEEPAENLIDR